MDPEVEPWRCPACGTEMDIGGLGLYASLQCPSCGKEHVVHTRLANYSIQGILGVGGMSVVFRARDMVLGRITAIKVLNETYRSQPERIARFENECAMMAKVRHENVVQVYSAGWSRGQFFIAMELVDGRNLEHVVTAEEPLQPATALEIARQVTLGLQAASRSGLLHRDMKPGNIIITREGTAKVLDFGLSLNKQEENTEETIWATPFYVAPETLQRAQEDVRTDIYALGMTLRYLLTGVESFADSPSSIDELLQSKYRLSRLSSECPHLDEALCDLVDHMTAYDPSERPENYRELLAEIREVQNALNLSGSPSTPEMRRVRQRRTLMGIAATLAAGAAAAYLAPELSAPDPVRRAVKPDARVDWDDLEQFVKAREAMGKNYWGRAKGLYASLAEKEGTEPAMGAWSALSAACLAVLRGESDQAEKWFHCMEGWMGREDASPAAAKAYRELALVEAAVRDRTSLGDEVSLLPLRGMCFCMQAWAYAGVGDEEGVEKAVSAAQSAFASAGGEWSGLAGKAPDLLSSLEPEISRGMMARARQEISLLHFDRARDLLESYIRRFKPRSREVEEARVLQEACLVGKTAFAMLEKRFPSAFPMNLQPVQVREMAAALGQGKLDEELYALSLLLSGDVEEAFKADPYRDDPSSQEAFAILMRDWRTRLSK